MQMRSKPQIQESAQASVSGIQSLAMVSADDLVLNFDAMEAVMKDPQGPWARVQASPGHEGVEGLRADQRQAAVV